MNNKQQELLDEAYENYTNYPLATRHDHRTNILYQNMYKGWCMLNGRSMASPHPTRHLTQEEFINKIKTDEEFSGKWGLKIEERELGLGERHDIKEQYGFDCRKLAKPSIKQLDDANIPTKLITITYNDKKIESYE